MYGKGKYKVKIFIENTETGAVTIIDSPENDLVAFDTEIDYNGYDSWGNNWGMGAPKDHVSIYAKSKITYSLQFNLSLGGKINYTKMNINP